uniref:Uncharacterized protein n=1 Tax=Anopheles epiroticus TaxID=199890 RepID=A0A182PDW7_9DIPT
MSIMCTLVSAVLASTLLLASVAFIGASSSVEDGVDQLNERELDEPVGVWELISAATVTPQESADRMRRFDAWSVRSFDEQDPMKAENSHVVVQVYSVDSDQEMANDSTGTAIRSLKVENFATPKEQMDGKPTDRVERKVFPPVRNIQEKLDKRAESSAEQSDREQLLAEQFFVDESATDPEPKSNGQSGRYSGPATESYEPELERMSTKHSAQSSSSYANAAPFYDYNEQTSQRMLDEFFALRNQDTLAARRANYDWAEGQLKSRTLEDIKNQNRRLATSRRKTAGDYSRDDDMSYDRYADYGESYVRNAVQSSLNDEISLPAGAEQRAVGYGGQKLGRKQRATPSTTNGQTHVLNTVPIVAYSGDGSNAPMYRPDSTQRSQFERSRFHYSLPSMVFNPYAWDPYHMNMMRFPQCSACQQNARALCSTCGLCADCCAHSKCTCGCLNG